MTTGRTTSILRTAALLAAVAAAGLAPQAAGAAVRKDCGGRATDLIAKSSTIALVVRARGEDDDLYGGDHRYFACYGKHGKSRILMDLRSPNYPTVGLIAFRKEHVAMELAVDDATCGKYNPGDECPILRTVSAWDVKRNRMRSQGHAEGELSALAVSPVGALAWVEPALAPATGVRIRAVFGEGGSSTVGTSPGPVTNLTIDRTDVRWTDASGEPMSAPVPPKSVSY